MLRRHAMLALTGAAIPLMLRPKRAAAQTTTPLDATAYTDQTLNVGFFSNTISQLALTRSASVPLRSFAQSEILEQTAIARSLTDNLTPPPVPLSAVQQETVATLQSLSGPQFDNQYITAEIQGHQQLLSFQLGFLQEDDDPTNDLVHIALIASAFIETHLLLLNDLGTTGHL